MTGREIYPGFTDPDDLRPARDTGGWPERVNQRVAQVVDDAEDDHYAKHRKYDHPWCRWCHWRTLQDEAEHRLKTPADLHLQRVELLEAGCTRPALDKLLRQWDGVGDLAELARVVGVPLHLIPAVENFAREYRRTDQARADAQQECYARAFRYLTLHRDPPSDGVKPRVELPALVSLADFLDEPDEDEQYRIQGLWPVEGRVVFAAQYKAGKSTTVGNVLRSLADGVPFLDEFDVNEFEGRIALIDNELSPKMLRRWLRQQGIQNTDQVHLVNLRGRVGTFDILDPGVRAQWAEQLRARGVSVVVLDCLRPVLDVLGLNEDKDAGKFLVAFDALLKEASAPEAIVIHHAGHGGERSRGDSRLRDWPDVEWKLVREGEDDSSPRYFSAYGRDVDQGEGQLLYDEGARRLSWAGGSRKTAAGEKLIPDILDYLDDNPGVSKRGIEAAIGESRTDVRNALAKAITSGLIITKPGPKRAIQHFRSPSAPSAPGVRGRTEGECASASIGALHSPPPLGQTPTAHSLVEIGPCTTCQQPTRRYGEGGSPICQGCTPILTMSGATA